jgi:tripartite-type tricarboxylate transporter receptor subunit TctC
MTTVPRRAAKFLILFAAACLAAPSLAQNYPTKPVRLLVGNAPGGGSDTLARALGAKLTEHWKGKSVVVENQAGALGMIAVDMTVKAAPDGHTLIIPTASTLVVPMLQKKIPYDVRTALTGITELTTQMLMMLAHPSLPANSVKELLAYAKANPGKLNLGTSGSGSIGHAGLAYINQSAGLDIQHVPFKGAGPSLQALLGGQIQLVIVSTIGGLPHVKSGKAKALGVTGPSRLGIAPDIPAIGETIPGFELTNWYGLYGPAGMPAPIVALLHRDVTRLLADPDLQARFEGAEATPSASPAAIRERLNKEVAKWEKLLQIPGFKESME